MTETIGATETTPLATVEAKPPAKMTWDEFHALIKRAEKGDRKSLPKLREVLKSGDYPSWLRWFRDTHGNPAEWLKHSLARGVNGNDDLAMQEATESKMNQIREELEGPAPTPTEKLLAERAALCWFIVNMYETVFSQSKDLTIRQADFHLRKIDSAHKRFLSAVATLARVRKLALPALQVNIGNNQVNVAGSG